MHIWSRKRPIETANAVNPPVALRQGDPGGFSVGAANRVRIAWLLDLCLIFPETTGNARPFLLPFTLAESVNSNLVKNYGAPE